MPDSAGNDNEEEPSYGNTLSFVADGRRRKHKIITRLI
ncbi:MAG: hypothetical protein ACI9DQ_000111 [Glaciecola sp.]|jgi:hypothetical protein